MLLRATKIMEVVGEEIRRREKAIEADESIRSITIEIHFNQESGNPVKTLYHARGETQFQTRDGKTSPVAK